MWLQNGSEVVKEKMLQQAKPLMSWWGLLMVLEARQPDITGNPLLI